MSHRVKTTKDTKDTNHDYEVSYLARSVVDPITWDWPIVQSHYWSSGRLQIVLDDLGRAGRTSAILMADCRVYFDPLD